MTKEVRTPTDNYDEEMSNAMRAFSGEDPDTVPASGNGFWGLATMVTSFALVEATRPARTFLALTTPTPEVRKILLHET